MNSTAVRKISFSKKTLIVTFLIIIVGPALLIGLTKTFGTLGGNKIYKSDAKNWAGTNKYNADFSNDDHWNQILPWILVSSENACNLNIKQWNQNEFLGTPYAQVGSTMNFAPQVAATCIAPKESRSALVAYFNILIIFFGMFLLMSFLGVKKWLARIIAFSASICGPVAVYLFWPHIVTLAWAPIVAYFFLKFLKTNSKNNFVGIVVTTSCFIFGGQLEVVLLGLIFIGILLLANFRFAQIKQQLMMYLKLAGAVLLSFMIASLSWLPTVLYAGTTPAGRERDVLTTDQYLGGFQWIKHIISGFIDPIFYGTSTPYSTTITGLPHARMTMWIPTIMTVSICYFLVTAIYKIIATAIREKKIKPNISRIHGQIFFMVFCFFVLAMIYGKLSYAMTIINKIPFFGQIDENLYRFSGIFLLFVIFGMVATEFTKRTWKIILVLSAFVFAAQAAVFFAASSRVDNFGFVKDLRKTLPNLNIANVYKVGFVISIVLCAICVVAFTSRKNIVHYGVALLGIVGSLSIFVLKPQNFVDVKKTRAEKVLVNSIKDGRLLAPSTHWSTIGTWYGIESVHGYSLPNNSNYAIDDSYLGCKFHAGFIFTPCDYVPANKSTYDLSNVQWVILKDGSEKIYSDVQKYAELANGFALYERPSGESSIFALSGSCEQFKGEELSALNPIHLKSDHKYVESGGKYVFEKSKGIGEGVDLTAKDTCLVFSVAYHDDLKVSSNGDLPTVNLHNYLAVDVKSDTLTKAQKWNMEFDNPNFLYSKIITLFGLVILSIIYFSKREPSDSSKLKKV